MICAPSGTWRPRPRRPGRGGDGRIRDDLGPDVARLAITEEAADALVSRIVVAQLAGGGDCLVLGPERSLLWKYSATVAAIGAQVYQGKFDCCAYGSPWRSTNSCPTSRCRSLGDSFMLSLIASPKGLRGGRERGTVRERGVRSGWTRMTSLPCPTLC